jgi:hypothetical protein
MNFYKMAALLIFLALSGLAAQNPAARAYPYYVKVLQTYSYPGTDWTSSPNEVEQVIAETPDFYIVTTTKGTSIQLPKSIATQISENEAASLLMEERKRHHDERDELVGEYNELVDEYDEYVAQAERYFTQVQQYLAQVNRNQQSPAILREYLQLMQELQNKKSQDKRRVPNQNRYEIDIR